MSFFFFFFNDPATTEIYTLPLHDALPIWSWIGSARCPAKVSGANGLPDSWGSPATPSAVTSLEPWSDSARSEEHTSELQSHSDLVCRLLLEKKKKRDRMQE